MAGEVWRGMARLGLARQAWKPNNNQEVKYGL